MKILIPVIGFNRTGGYRVLSELANTWIKKGHSVDFLCIESSADPYFPTQANILHINEFGQISSKNSVQKNQKGWHHIKLIFSALNFIGCNYDVILANHSLTAWPVAFANCGNAKKIYYVQAYEPAYYAGSKKLRGYLLAIGSALTYHFSLYKIVNSPIYFRYKNLRSSFFVPPGIDVTNFKPNFSLKKLSNQEKIIIGCIGRSEPEKGTIYVLKAFEELYKRDKRFVLRIANFGKLPEGWKHQQCETTVPKNDAELAKYYRSLDILIAPGTVQHGAPHYPVLEAAACGIPVVTTGYMGATDQTAWLVANKDSDSIVDAVLNVIKDEQLRIQKINKFLEIIEAYSWDNVADKMLKQFKKI